MTELRDTNTLQPRETESIMTTQAYWDLLGKEIEHISQVPQYEFKTADGNWSVVTWDKDSPDMNMAAVYKTSGSEEAIHAFGKTLRENKLPGLVLIPQNLGEDLSHTAQEQGFHLSYTMPIMVRSADSLLPIKGTVDVHEIDTGNSEHAEAVAAMQDLVFGMPAATVMQTIHPDSMVRIFVGWEKGKVVGTVTTIEAEEGQIGIWCMAVDPTEQAQGYGGDLLNTIMNIHMKSNAKSFHLLATEAGQPMYKNRGFQTIPDGQANVFEYQPL